MKNTRETISIFLRRLVNQTRAKQQTPLPDTEIISMIRIIQALNLARRRYYELFAVPLNSPRNSNFQLKISEIAATKSKKYEKL